MTAPAVSQPRASATENKPHNYNSIAATAVLILLAAVGAWSVNCLLYTSDAADE